ncbi:Hypp4344 [Branchiostoma lanceolatum]|uniref:Hypp4344 protein n=1 Tax=Branchiostoma lanceolatum TaxID=7740 RepID=A0A8K0EXU4_BRALA|nr:Hypp4344 [Branchiostoma lanceolatum]
MASFIMALFSVLALGSVLVSGIAIPTTDTLPTDATAEARSATGCGEPSAAQLSQLLSDCTSAINPETETLSSGPNPCEDGTCLQPEENDVSQRAYCPWQVVVDSNPNRFPTDIAYARCQSIFPGHHPNYNWNMGCDSITYTKPVLVREECGGADNTYRYKCVHLNVPNACVAAEPL